MKKLIGLFLAAIMAVSLFGCKVSETTKTRIANVPYSTTRQTTRTTRMPRANAQRRTTTTMPRTNSNLINRAARGAMPYVAAPVPNMAAAPYNALTPGAAGTPYAAPYVNSSSPIAR